MWSLTALWRGIVSLSLSSYHVYQREFLENTGHNDHPNIPHFSITGSVESLP